MRDARAAALKAWVTRRANAGVTGGRVLLAGGNVVAYNRAVQRQAATKVVRPARLLLSSGRRAMATNLGGKAKAGPPPTHASQLTAALKASVAAGNVGPHMLNPPRPGQSILSSARVARALGGR